MGHMDDPDQPHTITVFYPEGSEVFHNCIDVNGNDRELTFSIGGKHHEFYGVSYHIAQE